MEESKKPKKSWISYWLIALCVFMLLQAFVFPNLFKGRVKEVGYDTFISMTENKEIGSVKIESSQITFTDKDEKQVYQTGTLNDPELIDRLYASGAKFESEIDSGTSPLLYILISYVLPIALMLLVFHFFNKKMAQRMGGGDSSMMFGMGKSNAKVYVKSTTGIKFKDVAGEEEAKELLAEIVDYLHKPERYKEIGASMPKGALLVGPPGTGKTLPLPAKPTSRSSPFPVRNSWKCSWAWVPQRCVTCSSRQTKRLPVSSLSMRSIPLVKSVTADSTAATTNGNRP